MKKLFLLLFSLYFFATPSLYAIPANSSLIQALHDGNFNLAKELLDKGADVKMVQEFGSIALTQAVIKKDKDFIKFLLDHGADLFAPNHEGNIPWLMALSDNDEKFIEFLRTYQPKTKDALFLGAATHNHSSTVERP